MSDDESEAGNARKLVFVSYQDLKRCDGTKKWNNDHYSQERNRRNPNVAKAVKCAQVNDLEAILENARKSHADTLIKCEGDLTAAGGVRNTEKSLIQAQALAKELKRDLEMDWEKKVIGMEVASLRLLDNNSERTTWWVGEVKHRDLSIEEQHSYVVHFTSKREGLDYDGNTFLGIEAKWSQINLRVGVELDAIYEWKLAFEEMRLKWEPWKSRPTKMSKQEKLMAQVHGNKKQPQSESKND